MKNLALLFCLLPIVLFSQESHKAPHNQELVNFLSKVDHIELCELKPVMNIYPIYKGRSFWMRVVDADTAYFLETLLIENSIDSSRIGNRKKANVEVKKEIESVLLHDTYGPVWVASCYNPRNGLLFFDEKNQLLGYFEVCFECHGEANYLILNNQGFDKLKSLFSREGLEVN